MRSLLAEPALRPGSTSPGGAEAHGAHEAGRADALPTGRLEELCVACRTFGAPGYASHVLFRDARPQGKVHLERRDGVSIDRDLGRVSGGRKYDFEVVAESSRFDFGLTIDGADRWQEGLVALGLDMLNEGFSRVGGATSRGLGRVALDGLAVKVLDVEALRRGELPDGKGLPLRETSWASFREEALAAWQRRVKEGAARART